MKRLTYVVIVLIIALTGETYGQTLTPINAKTVLQLAGANNLTVKEYELRHKQAYADQVKAGEWWLPTLRAGFNTHYLNGAAMNTDAAILIKVNQNFLYSSLGFSAEVDFNRGRYEYLAATQLTQASAYASMAERNKVILSTITTYYDMQAAQISFGFLNQLAQQADTLKQQVEIQVNAGLKYQSEYLLAASNEVHYRIEALKEKEAWQKQAVNLATLLNLSGNPQLFSTDTVFIQPPEAPSTYATTDNGYASRPEYKSQIAELDSYEITRKVSAGGFMFPKLTIGTDDGLFGAYKYPLYNTYQLNASVIWTLPLGRLFKHGELQRQDARISFQQNKIHEFKNRAFNETRLAVLQIQYAYQQSKAASSAVKMASDALLQSLQRQQLGTAKAFEVLQAQQIYLQIRLDAIKSTTAYNEGLYMYKVAIGGDL
jgi:outer membrane protein TolC